jgi:hypothetical protein
MLVLYTKLTKKELEESAKQAIVQVTQWFESNPKRKVCKAKLWYGKTVKIRRGHVAEDVNAEAAQTET